MPIDDIPNDVPDDGVGNDIGGEFDSGKTQGENTESEFQQELLVSGLIYPVDGDKTAVEIRRGMTILTTEGEVAGIVAGVIHIKSPQKVEFFLLSRPSQQIEYRMVPITLVQQVSDETVLLYISAPLVNDLLPWHN